MTTRFTISLMLAAGIAAASHNASGQAAPPTPAQQPPSPATRLEAFRPDAGTLVTVGYDELGRVNGVSVDVREMRAAGGGTVRGLVVEVTEGQYRQERSFVDADEVAELVRGLDALLQVTANPTSFQNFEVRYKTRGELQLTAFNTNTGISYSVRAGRITSAQRFVGADDMQKLRAMFVTAQNKLAASPGS